MPEVERLSCVCLWDDDSLDVAVRVHLGGGCWVADEPLCLVGII